MSQTEKIAIEGPPQRLESQYARIFTKPAKQFLSELVTKFDDQVEILLLQREKRRIEIANGQWKPQFRTVNDNNWRIADIPKRIRNRKLDLGDISPANTISFTDALYADVQGIQVNIIDSFSCKKKLKCSFC